MIEHKIDILDYEYPTNFVIEVPGNVVLNIIDFCRNIILNEPNVGIPYSYPDNVSLVKKTDGGLSEVKIDWTAYGEKDGDAFFASMQNAVKFMTPISVTANQMEHAFYKIFEADVEAGNAKKITESNTERENEEFSELLARSDKTKK
jgi:hypothetical protein